MQKNLWHLMTPSAPQTIKQTSLVRWSVGMKRQVVSGIAWASSAFQMNKRQFVHQVLLKVESNQVKLTSFLITIFISVSSNALAKDNSIFQQAPTGILKENVDFIEFGTIDGIKMFMAGGSEIALVDSNMKYRTWRCTTRWVCGNRVEYYRSVKVSTTENSKLFYKDENFDEFRELSNLPANPLIRQISLNSTNFLMLNNQIITYNQMKEKFQDSVQSFGNREDILSSALILDFIKKQKNLLKSASIPFYGSTNGFSNENEKRASLRLDNQAKKLVNDFISIAIDKYEDNAKIDLSLSKNLPSARKTKIAAAKSKYLENLNKLKENFDFPIDFQKFFEKFLTLPPSTYYSSAYCDSVDTSLLSVQVTSLRKNLCTDVFNAHVDWIIKNDNLLIYSIYTQSQYPILELYKSTIDQKLYNKRYLNLIEKIFNIVESKSKISGYQWFIENFPLAKNTQQTLAIQRIHDLAFTHAKSVGTLEAYNDFIIAYPYAQQIQDATDRAYKLEKEKYSQWFENKEKNSRALLIKTKQLERMMKEVDRGAQHGYRLVIDRMNELLQQEYLAEEATLRYLESQEFKDFYESLKSSLTEINATLTRIKRNTDDLNLILKGQTRMMVNHFDKAAQSRKMAAKLTADHRFWERYLKDNE